MYSHSKQLGHNIKNLRQARGISPKQMADTLSMSPRAYADLENGVTKVDAARLSRIVEVLETTAEHLLHLHEKNGGSHNHFSVQEQNHCLVANNHVYMMDKDIYADLQKNTEHWRELYMNEKKARQEDAQKWQEMMEAKDRAVKELMDRWATMGGPATSFQH